jgi:rfaE bifunctional protein kinase chain/domain
VTRLLVVGDALLDRDVVGTVDRVCPDAPVPVVQARSELARPGGAGLAAAILAADGADVVLLTAIAPDAAGAQLRALLADAGVEVADLVLHGTTPEKVRIRAAGQSLLRLDRGEGSGTGPLTAGCRGALDGCDGVLVADYGRGVAAAADVRAALATLPRRVPVVWDPHPRGPAPVADARLVTPNASEAAGLVPEVSGTGVAAVSARATALARRWHATGVAVTMGATGALLAGHEGPPLVVPAPVVTGGDPCGAGDRFAGAAALALATGALIPEAVEEAVARASAFVAAGGAAAYSSSSTSATGASALRPPPSGPTRGRDVDALVASVRASGGTVVATGGCFDLLHAGHVGMLQAARRLGDCLVVLLNADASVARLKGEGRPVQGEEDRAAVLSALDCVDAVVVFGEVTDLPEARTLARWGGQAVVVPYLDGRSTTRLIEEAVRRART